MVSENTWINEYKRDDDNNINEWNFWKGITKVIFSVSDTSRAYLEKEFGVLRDSPV